MHRRTFLTAGSAAAIGFGVSACSTNPKPNVAARRPPVNLAPVKASWDRVIRTTVGLRPHRDAGFVLKPNPINGNIYVAGATASPNFPGVQPGVVQAGYGGGLCDGFVAEITSDGSRVIRSTYLGTNYGDAIYGLQIDRFGFPYVMGTTNGVWPVINAAYSNAGSRQFVSKLQPVSLKRFKVAH